MSFIIAELLCCNVIISYLCVVYLHTCVDVCYFITGNIIL